MPFTYLMNVLSHNPIPYLIVLYCMVYAIRDSDHDTSMTTIASL